MLVCSLVLFSLSCWSSLGFCASFRNICSLISPSFPDSTSVRELGPTLQPGKVLKAGLGYLPLDQKMGSKERLGHRKMDKEGQEWSPGNRKSSLSMEHGILPEWEKTEENIKLCQDWSDFLLPGKNRFTIFKHLQTNRKKSTGLSQNTRV